MMNTVIEALYTLISGEIKGTGAIPAVKTVIKDIDDPQSDTLSYPLVAIERQFIVPRNATVGNRREIFDGSVIVHCMHKLKESDKNGTYDSKSDAYTDAYALLEKLRQDVSISSKVRQVTFGQISSYTGEYINCTVAGAAFELKFDYVEDLS